MSENDHKPLQGTRASTMPQEETKSKMSRNSVSQEVPRERKRWIRPPLIGQASTCEHSVSGQSSGTLGTNRITVTHSAANCSHDSLPEDACSWSNVADVNVQHYLQFEAFSKANLTPPSSQSLSFLSDISMPANNGNANTNSAVYCGQPPRTLAENNFDIAQSQHKVQKENKPELLALTNVHDKGFVGEESSASVCEFANARAPSPASVSSVTSSRPLEWDSGADVGYLAYQISDEVNISRNSLSTIERIALAQGCSTALLMRLDPEGTKGPGQQSSSALMVDHVKAQYKNSKQIDSKDLSTSDALEMENYIVYSSATGTESENEVAPVSHAPASHENSSIKQKNNVLQNLTNDESDKLVGSPKQQHFEDVMYIKKLSNSLSNLNELEPPPNKERNSLHRSQSQISMLTECLEHKAGHGCYSSQSLPQNRKLNVATNSISSSSLATVVSKKDYQNTSDKLIQTSQLSALKQSVAVQVCDNECNSEEHFANKRENTLQEKHSYFERTGSTDDSELILEKSAAERNTEASDIARCKCNCNKKIFPQLSKTVPQNQKIHSSHPEKVHSAENRDKINSDDHFVMYERRQIDNRRTAQRDNRATNQLPLAGAERTEDVQNSSGTLQSPNSQINSSWFISDATQLERSTLNNTGQRGSMGAIDSAHSFEYLPGHIFENMSKSSLLKKNIREASLSSTSQQEHSDIAGNAGSESSASNIFSKDLERIVTQVINYLNGRPNSCSEKKELIKKIVKRLTETKYADDSSSRECSELTKQRIQTEPSVTNCPAGKRDSDETSGGKIGNFNDKILKKPSHSADSKSQLQPHQELILVSDKCIGTVFSEQSAPFSSASQSSALEAQISSSIEDAAYPVCSVSTSTSTTFSSNSTNWKGQSARLEKEYQLCKQRQKQNKRKSVLLNFCKAERENQLSWISTEIRHLNRLKHLLENQEKLIEEMESKTILQRTEDKYSKSSCSSIGETRRMETSETKAKRFLESCSTTSTDREIILPEEKNALQNNKIHRTHVTQTVDSHISKPDSKQIGKGNSMYFKSRNLEELSKIQDKLFITREKSHGTTNKSTQLDRKELQKKKETKRSKNEAIQTYVGSKPGHSFKTVEMHENLSSQVSSGRVNVYVQTVNKTPVGNELKNNKLTKALEMHNLSQEVPLCCCECQKLFQQVKLKLTGKTKVGDNHAEQNTCSCGAQSHSYDFTSDKISSFGTLRDAAELTNDSDCHAQIYSLKEAKLMEKSENVGIQTTLSYKETFVEKSNQSNPDQDHITDSRDAKCFCHSLNKVKPTRELESHEAQLSSQLSAFQEEISQDKKEKSANSGRKCRYCKMKELKKTKNSSTTKKCSICCIAMSKQSQGKKSINGYHLCDDCYQKTESSSATASVVTIPEPIGYILTLESASEISISERAEQKILKEIVMKVPKTKNVPSSFQTDVGKKQKQLRQNKKTRSTSKENHRPKHKTNINESGSSETISANGMQSLTLQEYLMINRPDFIKNAENRQSCLDDLAHMREFHQKHTRERLAIAANVNSAVINNLPPPPMAIKRVFSQRALRAQTEQKYHKLPEMQVKKVERKKKEEYRTNRLMAQIFAKKLQKKALRGEVSLSNSKSVISTH